MTIAEHQLCRREASAASAERDTAMIRAMAAGDAAFATRSELENEDTTVPSPRRDDGNSSDDDSSDDDSSTDSSTDSE